ncbi:hypothetical protein FE257_004717 [Aspergillus nanangensis]|uniref:Zn(2)-C6 fungal-type domain-containing protein n=1 Tax=Aspergillus nanangensis TaxID=2582783 RepID=A0AAD4CZ14_ASPNN|nr:hypothetical protein FE257_004717 [Aspergillus nanangensis]
MLNQAPRTDMEGENDPKARRACSECKAKKLRCVASREAPGVCHRCYQNGKDCSVPEARPRKRPSRLHTRMSHLEDMMGSLVDRFDRPQHPLPQTPINLAEPSTFNETQDPLTSGLVTFSEAEDLCRIYRQMSRKHFPCVVLPENVGVLGLQQERPMLLQAMLVVALWQDRPRQMALEKFYLRDVGTRFFVNGERSLDILQGLLVYLAWYHFNVTQSGQFHAYRLASLCATMIIDLGINKAPLRGVTQHELILNSQPTTEHITNRAPGFWSHEARRALIGAYIQSTLCSLMCRKQLPLSFTTYMEQCADSLREDGEVESDKVLIYFVQVLRMLNEVYHVFEYGDPDHSLSMGDDKVQMVVRALEGQLATWRTSLPSELAHHAQLNTWGDLVGVYAHEIGLHGNLRNPPVSATRVTIMFDCLANVEEYMKRALALSLEDMQTWTAFDWRQLTYTVMLASKISVAIDAMTADKESTARITQLDAALAQIYSRTQELFSMTNNPQGQANYFHSLLNQWRGIRSWYRSVFQKRNAVHNNELLGRGTTRDPAMFQVPNDSSTPGRGPPFTSLQSLDSWPEDNFGILPISATDFMMLESLGYGST